MNANSLSRNTWEQIAFSAGLDVKNGLLSKHDAALRQEIEKRDKEIVELRKLLREASQKWHGNAELRKRIDAKLAEPTP